LISTLLAVAAVVISFIAKPNDEHIVTGGNGGIQVSIQSIEPPPEEKVYVPLAPPPSEAAKMPGSSVKPVQENDMTYPISLQKSQE
jgi:hypothetical protein